MHRFVIWCGFVGAWLLFAGPVYQASTELDAEAREAGELRPAMQSVMDSSSSQRPSAWWWLLPPVGYALHRRWRDAARAEIRDALTSEQNAQLVHFTEKALGWSIVAAGAGLIAIDETWLLVHAYAWSTLVFWLIAAGMIVATFAFVSARTQRRYDRLELERPHGGRRRS